MGEQQEEVVLEEEAPLQRNLATMRLQHAAAAVRSHYLFPAINDRWSAAAFWRTRPSPQWESLSERVAHSTMAREQWRNNPPHNCVDFFPPFFFFPTSTDCLSVLELSSLSLSLSAQQSDPGLRFSRPSI